MSIRSFGVRRGRDRGSKWPNRAAVVLIAVAVTTVLAFAVRNIRRQDALLQWRQSLEMKAGRPAWPVWSGGTTRLNRIHDG